MYDRGTLQSSSSTSSLTNLRGRRRFRPAIFCFRSSPMMVMEDTDDEEDFIGGMKSSSSPSTPTTPRSPYRWLKSTAHELEIKDKCRHLFSRIGDVAKGRKYHGSCDFSYDPMSYALNFEDQRVDDDFQISFSSRLPVTPGRLPESKDVTKPMTVRVENGVIQAY